MTDPHDPYRAADPASPPPPAPFSSSQVSPASSSSPTAPLEPPRPPEPPGAWEPPVASEPPVPSDPFSSPVIAQNPVVYPPVSGVTAPLPMSYQPAAAGGASYGYDPITGQPLSEKSKIVAGLLQLIPGFILGLGGIGRLYAGHTVLGVAQLAATLVGWTSFWCGFFLIFPFFIYAGVWLWFVIDGIILLAGRSVDGQGRLLRA